MNGGIGKRRWSIAAAIAVLAVPVAVSRTGDVAAAPPGDDQIVAFLARGVGNGHGRGLSQWGAYGRAVNGGQSWTQILDAYYGGTTMGDASQPNLRVRLTAWDAASRVGVISASGRAFYNGNGPYAAIYAEETTNNTFRIFVNAGLACPTDAGWTELPTVTGPISFTTDVDTSSSQEGAALGVCNGDGSIRHYRGSAEFLHTGDGNRVVNQLDLEQYLRGVLPREVPATWGIAGNGAGINALQAQAVAARSYALSQNRYSYAKTCDTSSCQVYGGAATRPTAVSAGYTSLEHPQTDTAIAQTSGKVRYRNGAIVSTEFSASNGPRTAGGSFPAVDDPWDDVPGNPLHTWTRLIDADAVVERYDLDTAIGVATANDPDPAVNFDGIWDNRVIKAGGARIATAWDFRNAFSLPSPGFTLVPITRNVTTNSWFSFIGDSVGESVAAVDTSELRIPLDGVFTSATYDAKSSRRTQGGTVQPDGVGAAAAVPEGTDLVVVELGYNDEAAAMPARIDAVMTALRARSVGRVAWVNMSERRPQFAAANAALNAATQRWSELTILDWESASDDFTSARWFADNVHLTATGRAEFAMFLRDHIVELSGGTVLPRPLVPGLPLHVPVLGLAGVPAQGVAGVALNVTAVGPTGPGFLRVWPCGAPEPATSSVNFVASGSVEPNAVLVAVDGTGEVCVSTLTTTDVLVDVTGWFSEGFHGADRRLIDTQLDPGTALRVPVLADGQLAADVAGTALNVTAANPSGPGFLRVWPCGSPEPDTSSVNFSARGVVEPNAVVVGVDSTGEVCVSTLTSARVIVDQSGWFESGVQPAGGRLADTRLFDDGEARTLQPGAPMRVRVVGQFGVPETGVRGVALNVTAVNPSGPGFLRVWPCGSPEPETSSVNYVRAGAIEPNAVVVGVDDTGEICVSTLTPTEVLVDVSGWFESGLNTAGGRVVDTRSAVGPIPPR